MFWMCRLLSKKIKLNTSLLLATFLLALINSTPVLAHDIADFEVTEDDGVYYIKASIVLHAPADYIRNVLTDYVHIYRLNPSIIESEVLSSDNNSARVRTKVIGCIASYCEEFERAEDVHMLESGDIQAEIVPESGQFKSGITLWQIQSMGENTRLTYHAEMEPDFFIPPIIGSYIVKARLRDEITTSFARLEKIAIIQEERDWDPDLSFSNRMVANNSRPCDINSAGKHE